MKLDVTLEDFASAKRFLEEVLSGVIAPTGLGVRDLLTDTARERLVIACGGAVARDYLGLIADALDAAGDTSLKRGENEKLRVTSEALTKVASRRARQKEEDLGLDAGQDATALRARWKDVREFAKEIDRPYVLTKAEDLKSTVWGREMEDLEQLRLLHRIADVTPATKSWRGVNCVVFMIDYGFMAEQRLTSYAPHFKFWKGQQELDKLRRASFVYDSTWRIDRPMDSSSESNEAVSEVSNSPQLFDSD